MSDLFYEKVRSRSPSFGTWHSLGSPIVAELCAEIGLDWLLLDLEHGFATERDVVPVLQAVRGSTIAVVVRVSAPDASLIARLLDWGAHGIMVPHVSNAQIAADCIAAMRYPPAGSRGYSKSVRALRYGLGAPSSPSDVAQPILLAQIEDLKGVRHAQAIAQVDGVDGLFIGPSDLRLDLMSRASSDSLSFEAAVDAITAAAGNAGKSAGILLRDIDELASTIQRGITCVAIDSDLAILRAGFQRIQFQSIGHRSEKEKSSRLDAGANSPTL